MANSRRDQDELRYEGLCLWHGLVVSDVEAAGGDWGSKLRITLQQIILDVLPEPLKRSGALKSSL